MKRKITALLMATAIMCLGVTPAFAGNTDYNTGKITNYDAVKTYKILKNTENKKATKNADWFLNVKKISFTESTNGTLGMAFVPYKKSSDGSHSQTKADPIWAKKAFTSAKYQTWNGAGAAKVTYCLAVRLDTLLTKGSATSSGYWNAN